MKAQHRGGKEAMSASRGKPLLVAGHVTPADGPVQALERYLIEARADFDIIKQPLLPAQVRETTATSYREGRVVAESKESGAVGWTPLAYWRQLRRLETLVEGLAKSTPASQGYGLFIAIDVLNALAGFRLRRRGLVDTVVFYVVDWTPRRFGNPGLNWAYHRADRRAEKESDIIWNLSPRIAAIRTRHGVPPERNRVVPVGVELEKIPRVAKKDVAPERLIFVSHLTKGKGADLILDALPEICRRHPSARLEVIGTGPYEKTIRDRVAAEGLGAVVRFLGRLEHDEILAHLPACGIGLAPYEEDAASITHFSDATKPKEYLAAGLPVILTRVPWIAAEVERIPMGVAIDYDALQLCDAVDRLLADREFYWRCRANAAAFMDGMTWKRVFDEAFAGVRPAQ